VKKIAFTIVTFFLTSVFLFNSCVKPLEPDIPFDYEAIFTDEIQMPSDGSDRKLTFTIQSESNKNKEQVEVWLEGIPDKVTTNIEPKRVTPTANITLTFNDNYVKPGYYPAVLHTKSSSGIKKEYPFNLKAMDKKCSEKLSGRYIGPTNCIQGSLGTGNLSFTENRAEKNQLVFWWADYTRHAKINCYERTMTLLEQKIGDSTFSGHATYSEDFQKIEMTFIITRADGTKHSCTSTYTKS
jgi:hypothetical protein